MPIRNLRFLFLNLILLINTIFPSIISDTLIKTPHGSIAVENIVVDDTIIAYDQEKLSTATIIHISTLATNTVVAITTKKGTFYTCPDQQFFDPLFQQWIAAKDISPQNTFLDAQFNHIECLNVKIIDASATKIYRIATTHPHNFFITEQELLTHNHPVVIGIAWLFGEGLKFAGLTIGTTFLGSYIGVQLYNHQKQKNQACNLAFHMRPCGNPCPDPDDDENNERIFNSITKPEFFKMVRKDYEHWRNNVYRRKNKAKGIEDAEYLEWDYTHNDLEAYNKAKDHIGSINLKTLKIYKPPVHSRRFPGR